jgi:hypothetical protein
VAGLDFGDLVREAATDNVGMKHLTAEQEREIISDSTLMLIALCAVGNWTFRQIVDTYDIPEAECVRCLARLDRLRIIELGADNRIRPLIDRTFSWLPGGPIQKYFRARVESEFLSSKFDRPGELFLYINGMLSRHSTAEVTARMRRLAGEFADLHAADRALPLSERHGASMLLAIRPWEPRAFRALRRKDRDPVPAGRLLDPMLDRGDSPPAREAAPKPRAR